jgi:hypothetical protein
VFEDDVDVLAAGQLADAGAEAAPLARGRLADATAQVGDAGAGSGVEPATTRSVKRSVAASTVLVSPGAVPVSEVKFVVPIFA